MRGRRQRGRSGLSLSRRRAAACLALDGKDAFRGPDRRNFSRTGAKP